MRLIYGQGYNSRGEHKSRVGQSISKPYMAWRNMIMRCYCPVRQARQPTYIGCTVCEEWLDFQNFAEWYTSHEFYGLDYDLDKDLLIAGNKIYSPDTCCLIPKEINCLLNDSAKARGELPQGVSWHKASSKYVSQLNFEGKRRHLGLFNCQKQAYAVYKSAKENYVKKKATEYRSVMPAIIYEALMAWEL